VERIGKTRALKGRMKRRKRMAGTYTNLQFHIVFSTKERRPWIGEEIQARLYEYMAGIIRDEKGVAYLINGTPDHVHILTRWRADESLAALVRNVKARSSSWIHQTFADLRRFAWQEGYAAFTVSESQSATVRRYIANQKAHHRKRTFQEEYLEFLKRHRIEYNERYIWK
jgi:putative transposase